jgi:hypothetical protein
MEDAGRMEVQMVVCRSPHEQGLHVLDILHVKNGWISLA